MKPSRENGYGFELSAPLWRGARISVQGNQQKIRGMVNGNVLVPLPSERTALATDPTVRAYVQRILDAYPAEVPNRTDIDPRMLNTNSPRLVDGNTAGGQLDQNTGSNGRLSFYYLFVTQKVTAFQLVRGQNPDTMSRTHQAHVTWNRQWSPSTVADLSIGYDRNGADVVPEKNNLGPDLTIGGLQPLGPGGNIPIHRADNLFRQAFALRHTRGTHAFTIGYEMLRRQFNGSQSDANRGTATFFSDGGRDAITNLRLGIPTSASFAIGNTERGYRSWDLAFFAGDTWRPSSRVTVTLGVRFQPVPAPSEVNRLDTFPYGCDCNNLAPMAGVAYRLPGSGGVLRAAFSTQYGSVLPVTYGSGRFNPPAITFFIVQHPNLADAFNLRLPATFTGAYSPVFVSSNMVTPYTNMYSLTWQRELPRNLRLELGYTGSRSFKLAEVRHLNRAALVPGVPIAGDTIDLRRPDHRYTTMTYFDTGSRAWFDAARATLTIPRWRGLNAEFAYWFSKSLDYGTNYNDQGGMMHLSQNIDGIREDLKSLSDFDQPHSFRARASYTVSAPAASPRWFRAIAAGWNVSGIALAKTGTPFLINTGSDMPGYGNVDGSPGDRPNLLDPSILGRTIGNPDTSRQLMPKSAFSFIAPGAANGNLGRNVFRKGPVQNVNAALSRAFPVWQEKRLNLRAESVNFLNSPQFAMPGFNLADPNFGAITNTLNDGRTFRITASLEW